MKKLKDMSVKELVNLKCEIECLLEEHMTLMGYKDGDKLKDISSKELFRANNLSPFQRTVLQLRFQGMSFSDISDKTNKTITVVKTTYFLGLSRLHEYIERSRVDIHRNSPIYCLHLPTAITNALFRGSLFTGEQIDTVGDLMDISDEELLRIPCIGPTRLKEIRESIERANVRD